MKPIQTQMKAQTGKNNQALCQACGTNYFELVRVDTFDVTTMVVLGQAPVGTSGQPLVLLRCVKCGELHEPNVQLGLADRQRKSYDEFLDMMEKPLQTTDEDTKQ